MSCQERRLDHPLFLHPAAQLVDQDNAPDDQDHHDGEQGEGPVRVRSGDLRPWLSARGPSVYGEDDLWHVGIDSSGEMDVKPGTMNE